MSRPIIDGIFLDEVITDAELVSLADAFGGCRLHLPRGMKPTHRLAVAIGFDAAKRLHDAFGEGSITVPLCRELRAAHYRSRGESYRCIARRLGITEKGVAKMFGRINSANAPEQDYRSPL